MNDEGKYRGVWKKYLPVINLLLRKANESGQQLRLVEHEFTAVGRRELSGYSFNLEIVHGRVTNDISGTAVARDLYFVLNDNKETAASLKTRKIKISAEPLYYRWQISLRLI